MSVKNNYDLSLREEEIKKDEIKDIDKILYSMKELNFDKKKVKRNLNLDIYIDKYYGRNDILLILNDVSYRILPEARKIKFIDGKNVTEKFVFSNYNLKEILNKLEFKLFTINSVDNSYDSIETEIAQQEIYDIFANISINQITKINSELEIIIDKFRIRYSKQNKLISDLSLNTSSYYPENSSDVINYKILSKYYHELDKILCSDRNVIYLAGPKGTSKSLFLINFIF